MFYRTYWNTALGVEVIKCGQCKGVSLRKELYRHRKELVSPQNGFESESISYKASC